MYIFKLLFQDLLNIKIYLKNLNSKTLKYFFLNPISMRRIILRLKGTFYKDNGELFLKLPENLTFHITNTGIIGVLCEVFFLKNYDYDSKNEYTVIDIGMNTGCASLFFAASSKVKEVYAFEPFKPTFEKACYNFKLNKHISNKIKPFNFGVSNKEEIINLQYSEKLSPGMSTKGIDPKHNLKIKNADYETVEVKDILYIFNNIIPSTDKIIMKIDCEGSEYEIFESMDKNNLFKNIDIIMLEWHFKGPSQLLNILKKNNFISFLRNTADITGTIYSVKQK